MRITLKDILFRCLNALKKAAAQREKWLMEWPGQVCRSCQKQNRLHKITKRRGFICVFLVLDGDHSQSDPVDHQCHQGAPHLQREGRQRCPQIHKKETGS